jgi:hypothetical protein
LDYSESEEYDNDGDRIIPGRWSSACLQSPVAHGDFGSIQNSEAEDDDSSFESEEEEETAGGKSIGLCEETHLDEELNKGSLDFCDENDDSDAKEYNDDEDYNESTATASIQSKAMVETPVKWCAYGLSRAQRDFIWIWMRRFHFTGTITKTVFENSQDT